MRDQEHDHGEGEHHGQAQLPLLLSHAPLHGLLQGHTFFIFKSIFESVDTSVDVGVENNQADNWNNACDDCPRPSVIVDHIVLTLPHCCGLHYAPYLGATTAVGKIVAKCFHF